MSNTGSSMQSHIDHVGSEKSYGYTVDENDNRWFWNVPNDTDNCEVSFREFGYPTDHPYKKTGTVPERVRDHAQTHVDALVERNDVPWA